MHIFLFQFLISAIVKKWNVIMLMFVGNANANKTLCKYAIIWQKGFSYWYFIWHYKTFWIIHLNIQLLNLCSKMYKLFQKLFILWMHLLWKRDCYHTSYSGCTMDRWQVLYSSRERIRLQLAPNERVWGRNTENRELDYRKSWYWKESWCWSKAYSIQKGTVN